MRIGGQTMPHVIVKLWPGNSEKQKARLAEAITRDVMHILDLGEESVTVAMEEVEPGQETDTSQRHGGMVRGTPPPRAPSVPYSMLGVGLWTTTVSSSSVNG